MYIVTLVLTIAMALLGIGGVEIGLAYAQGQAKQNQSHLAQDYMAQSQQAYLAAVAAAVQAGTMPATGLSTSSGAPVKICGNGTASCNTFGAYTATAGGSTNVPVATGETSTNLNTNANESRASATLVVTLTNAAGSTLVTKSRTVTIRTIPIAPYASIVNALDTTDPYTVAPGTVGGVNTTTEGDSSGCDPTASNCGSSTLVNSYGSCNNLTTPGVPNQTTQPTQYLYYLYCQRQSNFDANGTSNTTYQPVKTNAFANKNWQNTDAKASGN